MTLEPSKSDIHEWSDDDVLLEGFEDGDVATTKSDDKNSEPVENEDQEAENSDDEIKSNEKTEDNPEESEQLDEDQQPDEIKELFPHITKFRPQVLELECKWKPFLPDFVPAVGDIDAFVKVERPDDVAEQMGLTVLDEPSIYQSDPSVLDLRLRTLFKQSSSTRTIVAKTVQDANKGKAIEKWIKDISDLHRAKPLPSVTYATPMPDIDSLMQEWPPEVEEVIQEHGIPSEDFECDLESYIDIACGLLDIPVSSGSRIHSVHLMLSLYTEMVRLQSK